MKTELNQHEQLRHRLAECRQQHRDLDVRIQTLIAAHDDNQFLISRLKREKLHLKDAIERLKSALIPDILA